MYKTAYKNMLLLMFQESIFAFLSLVDVTCTGALGNDCLLGVTYATTVLNLITNLHNVFTVSLRVIQARYIGANDEEGVKSALTACSLISSSIAAVVSIICLFFSRQILGLSALSPGQLEAASQYLVYRLPGYFLTSIYKGVFRTAEARGLMSILVKVRLINLVNIPLNLIFMHVLGVKGIALSTDITEILEFMLVLFIFKPKWGKPHKEQIIEVCRYGLAGLPQRFVSPLTRLFVQNAYLSWLSPAHSALMCLVDKFYSNICCIISGAAKYVEPLLGQPYGSGDRATVGAAYYTYKHCFSRILLLHIPIALGAGWIYLGCVLPSDAGLAVLLLATRIAVAMPYFMGLSLENVLRVYGVLKPVAVARVLGLTVFKLLALYGGLYLGMDVFVLSFYSLMGDLPCVFTTVYLIRKREYLSFPDKHLA